MTPIHLLMRTMYKFSIGDQIALVPPHAKRDLEHPDVVFGFVTSIPKRTPDSVFCRYWLKGKAGKELRTKANSELSLIFMLVDCMSCKQEIVDNFFEAPENHYVY